MSDIKIEVKDKLALENALNNLRVTTPEAQAAFKGKLRDVVGAELRKPKTELAPLAAAIEETTRGYTPPKNDDEAKKLKEGAQDMAQKLIDLKARTDAETAVKAFNDGLERSGGDKKSGLPMGAILGATGGLAAAMAMDVGDWKSLSGILKKLALVGAGLGVGLAVSDDFGVRTSVVNMASGDKKDKGTGKT